MPPRILLALLFALAAPAAAEARCEGEIVGDRLRMVEASGDLVTEGGRRLKIADIRLGEGASARLSALGGERLLLSMAGASDRWGRVPARIIVAKDGTDLAALLLRDGAALVDLGDADALCRPALLAAEREARLGRRGTWASGLLAASDPEALAKEVGRFAVAEGRVLSVGERERWTYLNFGRDFGRDFAVSISRRNWRRMQDLGLSAASLRGRTVRVRGIVEMRRAPSMEIVSRDMIEIEESAPTR